jgi:hypothetical protein
MWRYLRPLRAIEPEQSLAHPTLPCRIIRHQRITPRYLGTDPRTHSPGFWSRNCRSHRNCQTPST